MAVTDFTTFGRSLVDDANSAAARITLGLQINADVQEYSAVLASLGGNTGVATDRFFYTSSLDSYSTAPVTAFARTILDDANQGAVQTTLGLVIGTNVQKYDATLEALADTADTGFLVRVNSTSAGISARTLVAGDGIGIANTSGVAGDPTISLTWDYDSSGQTVTSASTLTLAHSLGARPKEVFLVLRCVTDDGDYVVSDEVLCPFFIDAGTPYGATATADATNVKVRTASGGHKLTDNSGASFTLTNARWRYVVRAR